MMHGQKNIKLLMTVRKVIAVYFLRVLKKTLKTYCDTS